MALMQRLQKPSLGSSAQGWQLPRHVASQLRFNGPAVHTPSRTEQGRDGQARRGVMVQTAMPSSAGTDKKAGGDVYVYEPTPLKEGEEKHMISVFVADESGLINRVAGVFARRGANIESLAVGLTLGKALFTISVTGTASTVANLVKQLGKLVKVRYVEDISRASRVERELMLMKIGAPSGSPERTEVLQMVDIFRAKVVDVSERSLTVAVTGDPGKTAAFQRVASRFGIQELARTGRICLKRGEALLEKAAALPEGITRRRRPGAAAPLVREDRSADVYMVDDNPEVGVWEGVLEEEELGEWQENTLLASSEEEAKRASAPINVGFQAAVAANELVPHTLSIEVADTPGVLNMVTGVIARRGYNIQSLAVGNSEAPGRSRITCTLPATRSSIAKLLKQLNKLVSVHKVVDLTELPTVARELLLVKLRCLPSQRGELRDLSQIFRANIVDVGVNTLTLEVMGKDLKAEGILAVLEPYGMLEVARTGRVALARDSGVSSKYLEKTQATRVW